MPPKTLEIYKKLLSLLDSRRYMTSDEVIEAFKAKYPDEWRELVAKYGDRDDDPEAGGARKRNYAASVYLADRLVHMFRQKWVDRQFTTDFDRTKYKWNRQMGTWRRLVPKTEPVDSENARAFTVRLTEKVYDKLVKKADQNNMSLSSMAAEIIAAAV